MAKWSSFFLLFFLVVIFLGSVRAVGESYPVNARTNCVQINATHRQCVQGSEIVNVLDENGAWKSCEEGLNYEVGNDFIEFSFGANKTRLEWNYDVEYIGFVNFMKRLFTNIEADASLDVEKRGCGFYFLQNFENEEFVLKELKYKMPESFRFEGNVLRNEGSGIFIDFNQAVYEQNVEIIESSGELVFSGENISRLDPTAGVAAPGTVGQYGSGVCTWTNVNNIKIEDGVNSACNGMDGGQLSQILNITNFSFSIDAGVTISGIEVVIKEDSDGGGLLDSIVQLAQGGNGIGSNYANSSSWTSGSNNKTYGSSMDKWGLSLTPENANNESFGIIIRDIGDDSGLVDANIDYVGMYIYYILFDADYPIFTDMNDNNGTLVDSGTVIINATISSTNGTAGVEFNGTNYTASNVSDFFNVSFSIDGSGNYSYFWWALGNGSSNNFNSSAIQSYVVNASLLSVIGLDLIYPTGNINVTQNEFFNVTVNVSCGGNNCGGTNVSLAYWNSTSYIQLDDQNLSAYSNCIDPTFAYDNDYDTQSKADGLGMKCFVMINYSIPSYASTNGTSVSFKITANPGDGNVYLSCWNYSSSSYSEFFVDIGGTANPTTKNEIIPQGCLIGDILQLNYTLEDDGAIARLWEDEILWNITQGIRLERVPVDVGDTFYTNISNPRNFSLNNGENELITFWVNASGNVGINKSFFAFANETSNMSISNITSQFNVTIVSSSSDSCVYGGTGNWAIDCSQNCTISSDTNLANDLVFSGAGSVNINSQIRFTSTGQKAVIGNGCKLVVNSGGGFV